MIKDEVVYTGKPLVQPAPVPAESKGNTPKGKRVQVIVPYTLSSAIAQAAREKGVTYNAMVVLMLWAEVGQYQPEKVWKSPTIEE